MTKHLLDHLQVKRGRPALVVPEKDTPRGPYFLSNLDQNKIRLNPNGRPINPYDREDRMFLLTSLEENLGMVVSTVYCYNKKPDQNQTATPGEVMKPALAKLLVEYYPFAGRLRVSPDEKLMVECTAEGAVFLEAEADWRMDEMGDPACPNPTILRKLVYDFTVENPKTILDIPLLMAQVTRFKCGGFVLGLSLNHAMVDGVSGTGFVKAWGELARGLPLSRPPFLDRNLLQSRNPPRIEFDHPEFQGISAAFHDDDDDNDGDEQLDYKTFLFGPKWLERVKYKAMEDKTLSRCTTFEALSAFVWRARTISLMDTSASSKPTKLVFPVDGRSRYSPPLPEGYFGNAIALTSCTCTEGELARQPLSHAARRVQQAIAGVDDRFMRSAIDYYELTRARPWMRSVLLITTWARLSFYETDFGWGVPFHSGPIGYPVKEVLMFLSDGNDKDSINLMVALPASSMKKFEALVDGVYSK
ncbi:hypothetical protein V2J09_015462 [Rumex salicifolius]